MGFATALLALTFSLSPQTQTPGPGNPVGPGGSPTSLHLEAWVDPVGGQDSNFPRNQVNDPDRPFKTLNAAIEGVQKEMLAVNGGVGQSPNSTGDAQTEGTVYALPGVYGPVSATNPNASGDTLPIVMRDRIHVQGMGARRCILRGGGIQNQSGVYWPDGNCGYQSVEILLDLGKTSHWAEPVGSAVPPPWWNENNPENETLEVFDGFTFQGGDIQVYMNSNKLPAGGAQPSVNRAVVSNCVFDMRDGWTAQGASSVTSISGPTFGAYAVNRFIRCGSNTVSGYLDTQLMLLNNTFVMAQWDGSDWIHSAKDTSVGVMNVNDPACNNSVGGWIDNQQSLRGLANLGVVNCVFRTEPGTDQMAMLGLSEHDTKVSIPGMSIDTNAFAPARVGSQSPGFPASGFASTPVDPITTVPFDPSIGCVGGDLTDCSSSSAVFQQCQGTCSPTPVPTCSPEPFPTPLVEIYDGVAGVGADPAFVGEYLRALYPTEFSASYADWRLLPGDPASPHPFKDRGYVPGDYNIAMASGVTFTLPDHPRAPNPFAWDGEHYGNPRIIDGSPDLGHDEIDWLIVAGSYANNSNSHNQAGALNPDLPTGSTTRRFIVRRQTPSINLAVGNLVRINGAAEDPISPQTGWSQPPGTLVSPTVKSSLPVDYQTKWIRFANASTPTPWEHIAATFQIPYKPFGALTQQHTWLEFSQVDDEGSDHEYFNIQAVLYSDDTKATDLLRSNLQVEYR